MHLPRTFRAPVGPADVEAALAVSTYLRYKRDGDRSLVMVESVVLSWMLTGVFAAVGLWCLVGSAAPAPGVADRISYVAYAVLSAGMIAMTWPWGMSVPSGIEVLVLGLAAFWFVFRTARERLGPARLPHLHHAVMAAAMVWMLVAPSVSTSTPGGGHDEHLTRQAMVSPGGLSALLAAYFVLVALPWLALALHHRRQTGRRASAIDAAGHAAMSAGMAVMVLAVS